MPDVAAPKKYRLSTGVGNLPPPPPRLPQFPPNTLLYAEKDGNEVRYVMRTMFWKRTKAGEPLPKYCVRLGLDFREARQLFDWLGGSGVRVELWNAEAELDGSLRQIGEAYGTWDESGHTLTIR